MKKLYTVILFLIAFTVKAQDFGAVGSEWYYSRDKIINGDTIPNAEYMHIRSVADTVILNKAVHKLEVTTYNYNGTIYSGYSYFHNMYVYQQSDTVYYNSTATGGGFYRFMVFNRNPGDTITLDNPYAVWDEFSYRLVVDSVTTVIIDGVPLKKYKVRSLDLMRLVGNYFMDRVGGLTWFFPLFASFPERTHGPLRCYSDPDVNENFWSQPCDFTITGTKPEFLQKTTISAFPNPFTNHLTIKLPGAHKTQPSATLYDLQGRKIYAAQPNLNGSENELSLKLPEVPSGLYFLHINTDNQSYTLKVQRQ